ncbi:metallophosphoesterase [Clostridium sp. SHJSY1]|uniref:metallophosphoesterase family protein n=1 Tax=Clostridium sp. SHJSY1 TaxID=2942483 RepID=UPI002875D698|nr:metallophosphoesterase [Clostridium sp. SHJSY1]MDS0528192.1 metallophosphoesterase [Clostridium sp. SHJSY1]
MRKVKILHSADLHFDTPFKEVGEKQRKINKEELKEVFIKIIHFCKEKSVDIFLLAGDVFDNFTLSKETLHFIEKAFKEIEDTKVFISPGNHDPYMNNSFYKLINWPDNVHIFTSKIEKVYIKELDVNVWGSAFVDKYIRKSIMTDFNGNSNKINLMVLHGEISSSSDGNEYNPITLSEISKSGMDYIALGHRHGFSGINKEGDTYYAYSGNPQGRGFDELGDKGIIYGYVSKGIVELEFIKTSKRNYEEVKVDVSNSFGYEEVKNIILNTIDENNRKNNLYRIILYGEISEEFNIDEKVLNEKISSYFYYCKVVDKTSVKLDIEEISRGYSVKSIFVRKIQKMIEESKTEEEREIIKMALKIGMSSLTQGEVNMDDY